MLMGGGRGDAEEKRILFKSIYMHICIYIHTYITYICIYTYNICVKNEMIELRGE